MSPMHCAVRCRNTAYLKLLLDAGEKCGNTVDSIEDGGWTAALRACEYANDDALQLIIEHGANLEAKLYATGMTALLMCVLHERYGCTRLLLEGGANVNATDMYGSTPLMLAAEHCEECWGHAFSNMTSSSSNRDATAYLSLLIAHKADVNATNRRQGTALILASYHGLVDCVRMLLGVAGIDIEAMDDDGDTALSCAADKGHADIVALLIEHGANVNVVARLWVSAKQGKARLLSSLLPCVVQVAGTTPLMRAAQNGRTECVKVLLRNGAHCDVRNADGKTAADIADEAGHHDLARHIEFLA